MDREDTQEGVERGQAGLQSKLQNSKSCNTEKPCFNKQKQAKDNSKAEKRWVLGKRAHCTFWRKQSDTNFLETIWEQVWWHTPVTLHWEAGRSGAQSQLLLHSSLEASLGTWDCVNSNNNFANFSTISILSTGLWLYCTKHSQVFTKTDFQACPTKNYIYFYFYNDGDWTQGVEMLGNCSTNAHKYCFWLEKN